MSSKRRKAGAAPRGGRVPKRPDGVPERNAKGSGATGQAVPSAFRRPDAPRVDVGRLAPQVPPPGRADPAAGRRPRPATAGSGPARQQPPPSATRASDVPKRDAQAAPVRQPGWLELGCLDSTLTDHDPQVVAASYSFDTHDLPAPTSVAIGFIGTRVGGAGAKPDRFERVERLGTLDPRAGRVTVTARVPRVPGGRWRVTAGPVEESRSVGLPVTEQEISTRFGALAQGPGVRVLAWPGLVALGAVLALVTQALLLSRSGLPVASVLALGVLSCLTGYVGGKVWYLALHRRPLREFLEAGAGIQGFLVVALGMLTGGLAILDLPLGPVLDATAPGVFLGMAVGRPGCLLTGCCVGRPTLSRWGLWSSDRRLGIRRLPVQLFEAAVAFVVGLAGLLITITGWPLAAGTLFVASVAAWTLARQLLFPLRADPHTSVGRWLTAGGCVAVLVWVAVLAART